jgi:hypothetical protein
MLRGRGGSTTMKAMTAVRHVGVSGGGGIALTTLPRGTNTASPVSSSPASPPLPPAAIRSSSSPTTRSPLSPTTRSPLSPDHDAGETFVSLYYSKLLDFLTTTDPAEKYKHFEFLNEYIEKLRDQEHIKTSSGLKIESALLSRKLGSDERFCHLALLAIDKYGLDDEIGKLLFGVMHRGSASHVESFYAHIHESPRPAHPTPTREVAKLEANRSKISLRASGAGEAIPTTPARSKTGASPFSPGVASRFSPRDPSDDGGAKELALQDLRARYLRETNGPVSWDSISAIAKYTCTITDFSYTGLAEELGKNVSSVFSETTTTLSSPPQEGGKKKMAEAFFHLLNKSEAGYSERVKLWGPSVFLRILSNANNYFYHYDHYNKRDGDEYQQLITSIKVLIEDKIGRENDVFYKGFLTGKEQKYVKDLRLEILRATGKHKEHSSLEKQLSKFLAGEEINRVRDLKSNIASGSDPKEHLEKELLEIIKATKLKIEALAIHLFGLNGYRQISGEYDLDHHKRGGSPIASNARRSRVLREIMAKPGVTTPGPRSLAGSSPVSPVSTPQFLGGTPSPARAPAPAAAIASQDRNIAGFRERFALKERGSEVAIENLRRFLLARNVVGLVMPINIGDQGYSINYASYVEDAGISFCIEKINSAKVVDNSVVAYLTLTPGADLKYHESHALPDTDSRKIKDKECLDVVMKMYNHDYYQEELRDAFPNRRVRLDQVSSQDFLFTIRRHLLHYGAKININGKDFTAIYDDYPSYGIVAEDLDSKQKTFFYGRDEGELVLMPSKSLTDDERDAPQFIPVRELREYCNQLKLKEQRLSNRIAALCLKNTDIIDLITAQIKISRVLSSANNTHEINLGKIRVSRNSHESSSRLIFTRNSTDGNNTEETITFNISHDDTKPSLSLTESEADGGPFNINELIEVITGANREKRVIRAAFNSWREFITQDQDSRRVRFLGNLSSPQNRLPEGSDSDSRVGGAVDRVESPFSGAPALSPEPLSTRVATEFKDRTRSEIDADGAILKYQKYQMIGNGEIKKIIFKERHLIFGEVYKAGRIEGLDPNKQFYGEVVESLNEVRDRLLESFAGSPASEEKKKTVNKLLLCVATIHTRNKTETPQGPIDKIKRMDLKKINYILGKFGAEKMTIENLLGIGIQYEHQLVEFSVLADEAMKNIIARKGITPNDCNPLGLNIMNNTAIRMFRQVNDISEDPTKYNYIRKAFGEYSQAKKLVASPPQASRETSASRLDRSGRIHSPH